MRNRDVAGHAGRDRHRQAHQPGLHFIQRGGFGVQRHQRRLGDLGHPGVEGVPIGDDAVILFRRRHGRRGGHARVARRHALGVAGQVAQPGAETVALVQFDQGGVVALARRQVLDALDMTGQVAVALHRQQLARERKFGIASRRLLPATPLMPSASAISWSIEPYSEIHLAAVLGPTLVTPGTLSTVSPTSIR